MELINIVSREVITPSCETHHLKPYNLCLIDQLSPKTYVPIILFYSISDPKLFDLSKTLTIMKKSLSQTLTIYYPFSGRINDDMYIDDFHNGVPFLQVEFSCKMSEFFRRKFELSNQSFPPRLFWDGKTMKNVPLIAFQVNTFTCGGIALAIFFNHTIGDATTLSNFLKSWAAFSTRSFDKVINPNNLYNGAILFPPQTTNSLSKYESNLDPFFLNKEGYTCKRFVFSIEAIQTLIEIVRSEHVPKPTRNMTITCFILKHVIAALWSKDECASSHDIVIAKQAMNLRPRMKPQEGESSSSLDGVMGNIVWVAQTLFDHDNDKNIGLSDLAGQFKEAIERVEEHFLCHANKSGEEASFEILKQLELMSNYLDELENPSFHSILISNWKDIFNGVDFGFGKPFKVGSLVGKIKQQCSNYVLLVDVDQWGKGSMEAFIALEDKYMAILESDHKFLALTSKSL